MKENVKVAVRLVGIQRFLRSHRLYRLGDCFGMLCWLLALFKWRIYIAHYVYDVFLNYQVYLKLAGLWTAPCTCNCEAQRT